MNNINQKNALMREHESIGLPYAYAGHVGYESATNISQTSLNNTFQQLVDNDLYIENKLANDYAYQIGPKPYNESKIAEADDGYKTWGPAGSYELSIVQKNELSLQESLTRAFSTPSYFVLKYSGQYYAGNDDGLIFADDAAGEWRMLQHGRCRGYCLEEGSNVLLFAFDDGIWHLKLSPDNRKKLVKITAGQHSLKTVLFRPADSLIVAVGDGSLWSASYSKYYVPFDELEDNFETVQLQQTDIYNDSLAEVIDSISANAFADVTASAFPRSASVFAGTTSGLAQLSRVNDFTQFKTIPSGFSYTTACQLGQSTLVGTDSDGVLLYLADSNQLEETTISSGSTTCMQAVGDDAYACVAGQLWKNVNGSAKVFEPLCLSDENGEEVTGISKLAVVGDSSAYAVAAVDASDKLWMFFKDSSTAFKLPSSILDDGDSVVSICSHPSKLQLDIAARNSSQQLVIMQVQFKPIHTYEDYTIDSLHLEADGNAPAIVAEDSPSVLKALEANGKSFLLAEHSMHDSSDYSVSCAFTKHDGSPAKVHDAKCYPSKDAVLVMFSDSTQLSAVSMDLSSNSPASFYYVQQIASAMSSFGMEGVYAYEEAGNYAFIVTKQTSSASGISCTAEDGQTKDMEDSEFFIAYADIGNVGMPCGKFLHSPVNLDVATTEAGTFSSPPELHAVDGNIVVFDKEAGALSGFFYTEQQQVQFSQTFFKLPHKADETAVVDSTFCYSDIVLNCARIVDSHDVQTDTGLFMNQISGATRTAAGTYQPAYSSLAGKASKQVLRGNVYRVRQFYDDTVHVCTSSGVYETTLPFLSSLARPIDTDTIEDGPAEFKRVFAGDIHDIAQIGNDFAIGGPDGLSAVSYHIMDIQTGESYTNEVVSSDSCTSFTVPCSDQHDLYFQIVSDPEDANKARWNRLSVLDGGEQLAVESGLISNVQNEVVQFAYARCYYPNEPDEPIHPESSFVAMLDLSGSIYTVHGLSSQNVQVQQHSGVDATCIATAGFLASVDAGSESSEMLDARILLAASVNEDSAVEVHAKYIASAASTQPWQQLQTFSLDDGEQLLNMAARTAKYSSGGAVDVPCIYITCITSARVHYIRLDTDYTAAYLGTNTLPDEVSTASWKKNAVVDNVLYVLDQQSTLYAVVLRETEVSLGIQLSCALEETVDDAFFGYSSAAALKQNELKIAYAWQETDPVLQYKVELREESIKDFDLADVDAIQIEKIDTFLAASCAPDTRAYTTSIFTSRQAEIVEKSQHSGSVKKIVKKQFYQSSQNNFNLYVLQEDKQLLAFELDTDINKLKPPLTICQNDAQDIIDCNGTLKVWTKTSSQLDSNGTLCRLQYIPRIGSTSQHFTLDEEADLDKQFIVDSQKVEIARLHSADNALLRVAGIQYNAMNLLLGVKQSYIGIYAETKQHPMKALVQLPSSLYMLYSAAEQSPENTSIQMLESSKLTTNGRLLAIKKEGSSFTWHEVDKSASLHEYDTSRLPAGGKLAKSILDDAGFSTIDKIVCRAASSCFVHGEYADSSQGWSYSNYGTACQKLSLVFNASGIPWIDQHLNDMQVLDILADKSKAVVCASYGAWKTLYSHMYEFSGQESCIVLNADGIAALSDAQSIELYPSGFYKQFDCIARVEKTEDSQSSFSLSGIVHDGSADDGELAISKQEVFPQASAATQLLVASESPYTDILAVVQAAGSQQLYWKHGAKSMQIEDRRESLQKAAAARSFSYAGGLLYVLGDSTAQDSKSSFRFESFKRNKLCFRHLSSDESSLGSQDITMFMQLSKSTYAAGIRSPGQECSIVKINFEKLKDAAQLLKSDVGPAYCAAKLAGDDAVYAPTYYFPCGSTVFSAQPPENQSSWKEALAVEDSSAVYGIYADSAKKLLVAADSGLYYTYSKYTLENDIQKLSPNDVLDLFYANVSAVDDAYDTAIQSHIASRHAPGSVLTRINNETMDTKFSNMSEEWVKYDLDSASSGETIVVNDMLNEVKFGKVDKDVDQPNGPVKANVKNPVHKEDNIRLNYIMKRWMSGYTELYVNLPTTHTYYLNHVLGTPNCTVSPDELIERKNLSQLSSLTPQERKLNSKPADNCTHIELLLDAADFTVSELLGAEIHGNSLPLKIYRDNIDQHFDTTSSRLYQSFVLPSVVEDAESLSDGSYKFKFACFGTDAQAIKITFNDYVNRYGAKYFTVAFSNNCGAGALQSQKIALDASMPLRKNTSIYKANAAFIGWSVKAEVDGMADAPMFYDGDTVSKELLEAKAPGLQIKAGSTVTLFAVWQPYELPDDTEYTVLEVTCPASGTSIAPLTTYGFDTSAKPDGVVVVDYGD